MKMCPKSYFAHCLAWVNFNILYYKSSIISLLGGGGQYGDTVLRCCACFHVSRDFSSTVRHCSRLVHVSREDLLHICETSKCEYRPSFLLSLDNFAVAPDLGLEKWPTSKEMSHVHRPRRRGRCGGALGRLGRRAHRLPLPAIVLSNVRSLNNKTDELFNLLCTRRELRDSSVLYFTETWLRLDKPDVAINYCPWIHCV